MLGLSCLSTYSNFCSLRLDTIIISLLKNTGFSKEPITLQLLPWVSDTPQVVSSGVSWNPQAPGRPLHSQVEQKELAVLKTILFRLMMPSTREYQSKAVTRGDNKMRNGWDKHPPDRDPNKTIVSRREYPHLCSTGKWPWSSVWEECVFKDSFGEGNLVMTITVGKNTFGPWPFMEITMKIDTCTHMHEDVWHSILSKHKTLTVTHWPANKGIAYKPHTMKSWQPLKRTAQIPQADNEGWDANVPQHSRRVNLVINLCCYSLQIIYYTHT